jgi:hypothetical protein
MTAYRGAKTLCGTPAALALCSRRWLNGTGHFVTEGTKALPTPGEIFACSEETQPGSAALPRSLRLDGQLKVPL